MEKSKFITFDNLKYFWGKVKNWFTEQVNGLIDAYSSSDDGKFVSKVESKDGKISVTYTGIKQSDVAGLENKLSELQTSIGTATSESVVAVVAKDSPTEGFLKTYQVTQNGVSVGEIDIPKDFLVKRGELSGTGNDVKLVLTLNTAKNDDEDSTVEIPVGQLCDVYTTGVGLDATGHEFKVKIDATGETKYLSVSAAGVKLSGIDAAISAAVSEAKEEILGDSDTTIEDLEERLDDLETNSGKIDSIKYNGQALTITSKSVDLAEIFETVTSEEIDAIFNS